MYVAILFALLANIIVQLSFKLTQVCTAFVRLPLFLTTYS